MQNNSSTTGAQQNIPANNATGSMPATPTPAGRNASSAPGGPPPNTGWGSPSAPPFHFRPYPAKLDEVDDGRVVRYLKQLREKCEETPPGEFYLVLNPSEVGAAAEIQFSRKARGIEGWRNGLILLPIMITWISLGLAGLAYTQSIGLNPKLVAEPFLQQWADGFTILHFIAIWSFHLPLEIGKWRYFSFGDVAALDCLLFAILLFLTWRAQSIEAKAHKAAIELSTWLREECNDLRIRSYARALGPGEAPPWAAIVNKSIADLQVAMKDMVSLIHSFDRVLDDDRELVNKVLAAVYNLNGIYESGRDVYEKLNATLPRMDRSFEKMADSQDVAVRSLDRVATAVNASSDAVVQLARPFATVGVAQLANEVFNQYQRVQSQQGYIQNTLQQQINAVNQMRPVAQQSPTYPWWNMRRFFIKSRRTP